MVLMRKRQVCVRVALGRKGHMCFGEYEASVSSSSLVGLGVCAAQI